MIFRDLETNHLRIIFVVSVVWFFDIRNILDAFVNTCDY
jgi:hypothetical protein